MPSVLPSATPTIGREHASIFGVDNPQSAISSVAGSPLWQVVFISFGVILILFEVLRGWRLGLMRQIMRLIAIGVAYGAAFLGSVWLVPAVRPFFKMPDPILSILCGAILAVAAYMLVSGVGAILFKRTSQQESRIALPNLRFCRLNSWIVFRSLSALADCCKCANSRRTG